MSPALFHQLLNLVAPKIVKRTTVTRKPISPAERLAITLRFMATGESFRSLQFQYRVGERTISEIVKETSMAISDALQGRYLKVPNTSEEWQVIAKNVYDRWQYPLCLGALDGTHFAIKQPDNSGSTYFNYKGFFSVVLLALAGADYRFLYVNIGATGRSGDAGIFMTSSLRNRMVENALGFPSSEDIASSEKECNYHIIGDDAFPLRQDLMKPYSNRNQDHDKIIFNYRFSRARRVVENYFGILANRFRVFLSTISLEPEYTEQLIIAGCCLHNFLIEHQSPHYLVAKLADSEDEQYNQVKGSWRKDPQLTSLECTKVRNNTANAKDQRDILKDYFISSAGAVAWQENMIA